MSNCNCLILLNILSAYFLCRWLDPALYMAIGWFSHGLSTQLSTASVDNSKSPYRVASSLLILSNHFKYAR